MLGLRLVVVSLIWVVLWVYIPFAYLGVENSTDALILVLLLIMFYLCAKCFYEDIKNLINIEKDLFFSPTINTAVSQTKETTTTHQSTQENKEETKMIKFEKLDEIRTYLYKQNHECGLPVSHKQYGVGETRKLVRGDGNNEYLTVEFLRAKGEKNTEIKFPFPNCFLQGKLVLLADWKERVGEEKSVATHMEETVIVKGEKINEKQANSIKNYLREKPNSPIMVYCIINNQEKARGRIKKIEGDFVFVDGTNGYQKFSYPQAFVGGVLRLFEGTLAGIQKYYVDKLTRLKEDLAKLEKEEKQLEQKEKTQEIKKGNNKIIRADTHAEFLNKVFDTNYQKWYKCGWQYNRDTIVWMVRFYGITFSWKNRFIDADTICEEYVGKGKIPPVGFNAKKRIAVSIEDRGVARRYEIKGLFELVQEESGEKFHIYKRVKFDTITPRL